MKYPFFILLVGTSGICLSLFRPQIALPHAPVQAMRGHHNGQDTIPVLPEIKFADTVLPSHRVVAMYGNFYSARMGILGELSESALLALLRREVRVWQQADTLTPVIPAIHYIAVTAQRSPGSSGKYRLRMPDQQIRKAIELGRKAGGITFLDIQAGHSPVMDEVALLEKYLQNPDVHLALDPEWVMQDSFIPGDKVGSMHADDINAALAFLAKLADRYCLPPKILVVHSFRRDMIRDFHTIRLRPQTQLVINMDGFGFPARKKNSYYNVVKRKPMQYTGIKLFYKNDMRQAPYRLMTPGEILALTPRPMYIQYQ